MGGSSGSRSARMALLSALAARYSASLAVLMGNDFIFSDDNNAMPIWKSSRKRRGLYQSSVSRTNKFSTKLTILTTSAPKNAAQKPFT